MVRNSTCKGTHALSLRCVSGDRATSEHKQKACRSTLRRPHCLTLPALIPSARRLLISWVAKVHDHIHLNKDHKEVQAQWQPA